VSNREHTEQKEVIFLRKSRALVLLILITGLYPVLVAVAAPPGPTIVDVAIAVNSDGPFAGQFDSENSFR
jgi:hypothetical protein